MLVVVMVPILIYMYSQQPWDSEDYDWSDEKEASIQAERVEEERCDEVKKRARNMLREYPYKPFGRCNTPVIPDNELESCDIYWLFGWARSGAYCEDGEEKEYKYMIEVTSGMRNVKTGECHEDYKCYAETYYTNAYNEKNGCISFQAGEWETFCIPYSIYFNE